MTLGVQPGVKTCDDCTEQYAGPAYYTFPTSECRTSDHDGEATPHEGCTGNLCPRCAGPDLEPDPRVARGALRRTETRVRVARRPRGDPRTQRRSGRRTRRAGASSAQPPRRFTATGSRTSALAG